MYDSLMESKNDVDEDKAIAAYSTLFKSDDEVGEEIQAQAKKEMHE
jgi:hypothetical protein